MLKATGFISMSVIKSQVQHLDNAQMGSVIFTRKNTDCVYSIFWHTNATTCGTHIYKKHCVCIIYKIFFLWRQKTRQKMTRVYNYTAKYVSVIWINKNPVCGNLKAKVKSKYISPNVPK